MRASVTVLPAMCTTPYWRRLTVPSGPTRYWPVTGWAPETRASCTLTAGSRSHWLQPLVQGRADLVDGHAGHADGAVDGTEVDRAFGLDHVVVVDGLVGQGVGADLQHVEDLGPIGRQGDELEHLDLDHVRRLDAIGRQGDLVHFPRRLEGLGHGRFQSGIVGIDGAATGQQQRGEPDGREGRPGKAGDFAPFQEPGGNAASAGCVAGC